MTRLAIVLSVISLSACASLPNTMRQIHTGLNQVEDQESRLCHGADLLTATPPLNTCQSPLAPPVGLSNAKHQALSRQMATVATANDAAVTQIQAGVPTNPLALVQALADLWAALQSLRTSDASVALSMTVQRTQGHVAKAAKQAAKASSDPVYAAILADDAVRLPVLKQAGKQ